MLQTPFEIDGLEVVMDASVGVALCPDNGVDADSLLQRADVAMYQAKEAAHGLSGLRPDARPALARAARADGRAAARARARRADPALPAQGRPRRPGWSPASRRSCAGSTRSTGCCGPGAFLPLAEHTGADAAAHAARARDRALASSRAWRADGLDLHVAVNLAVQNLLDLRTPGHVAELLERHGLPPEVLTLEVTESLMLHDPQRAGRSWPTSSSSASASRSTTSAPATPRSSTSSGCRSTSSRSTSRS